MCVGCAKFVNGQGMTVDATQLIYHTDYLDYEAFQFLHVSNNTADTLVIKWTREETELQPNWYTTICDNQGCFLPTVGTETFFLEPGLTGWLKLSLYPDSTAGTGSANLTLEALDRPDIQPVNVEYLFFVNGPTAIHQPVTKPQIKTYYNKSQLVISGLPDGFSGSMSLLSVDGRIVTKQALVEKKHGGDTIIDADYMKTGLYVIYLADKFGTFFSGKLVVTNQ